MYLRSEAKKMEKTVHRIHFEDRSGEEFERLCFAYLYQRFQWISLDWYGQCGKDEGCDIIGVYEDEKGNHITHIFQCANYRSLTSKKACDDLDKIAKRKKDFPDRFTVICGGKVSALVRDKIYEYAKQRGIIDADVWSGTELEERLRKDTPKILKRFVKGVKFPKEKGELEEFLFESKINKTIKPKPYDYKFKHFYGEAKIKYGDNTSSLFHIENTVEALKNNVNKYFYYNSNPRTFLKMLEGFKKPIRPKTKITVFPETEAFVHPIFGHTHIVPLRIPTLHKSETLKIIYDLEIKIGYPDYDEYSKTIRNGCYFRMTAPTDSATLEFTIPKLTDSPITNISFHIAYPNNEEKELTRMKEICNQTTKVKNRWGNATVLCTKKDIRIKWNIDSKLEIGTKCIIRWTTNHEGN